ncbi:hypothetical protein BASA84_000379 [Batrachochytrium salamandrivorans]|nr:hypothetical protein BASA84_000379 [Batrachochytrium salamandrivorans]
MQFFYLLSFVVVASYAAALPQPAGLSEKYSSNVDITLASILEARSYQPVSNTREDSDTLVLLKRQANSGGSSGGRLFFGTSPLPDLSLEEAKKLIDRVFKQGDLSLANISSTIDNVGNGFAEISENGEKVVTRIVGTAGGLLARYLRRSTFAVLDFSWETMESVTGAYPKEKESDDLIANILKDTGAVRQKVEAAIELLVETVVILLKPLNTLKTILSKSEEVKIIYDQISTMMESLTKFTAEQQKLYDELMQALGNEFF